MGLPTRINVVPLAEGIRYRRVTYVQVKKACGKKMCSVCHGSMRAHGPYWQLVEWDKTRRKKRTTYIGKQLPPEAEAALRRQRRSADPEFHRLVHRTEELLQERERQQHQIARLQRRIARLEVELRHARAQVQQRVSVNLRIS
jgi:Domain of unknown function (DUF4094)